VPFIGVKDESSGSSQCDLHWKHAEANPERYTIERNTTGQDGTKRRPAVYNLAGMEQSTCSRTPTSDHVESSIKTFLLEKSDLFSGSFVLVNALTVLDIMLSRRTKPWRFFLRILYRISRANLKWAVFWLICLASSQLGSQFLIDQLGSVVSKVMLTDPGMQIQRAWITMQLHPILSTLSFFIYNLFVGWLLRHFMPRNDLSPPSDGRSTNQNGSAPGNPMVRRVDQSRWSLLIDCIFRPVSSGTAQNLADLDFELDDNMELLIERLALPNLWLTPVVPTDYLKYLPVWQFDGWDNKDASSPCLPCAEVQSTATESRLVPNCVTWNPDQPTSHPSGMIPSFECAICLEKYRSLVHVCGLPCGHHFHHDCIMIWLQRDNHHCPICRWPAYQAKRLSTSSSSTVRYSIA
jgi:E3 ubiquitin-protein ligase RNF103